MNKEVKGKNGRNNFCGRSHEINDRSSIANPRADKRLPATVRPFVMACGIAATRFVTRSVPKKTVRKIGMK